MEQLRCHRCKRLGHIAKNCQNKSDIYAKLQRAAKSSRKTQEGFEAH